MTRPEILAQVARTRKALAGVPVTIRRGNFSATVTAVIGQTIFDGQTDVGITQFRSRDFLIVAADYNFGAGPVEPDRSDLIDETVPGAKVIRHEVLPEHNAEPWRWSDESRTTYRIHTKQIAEPI